MGTLGRITGMFVDLGITDIPEFARHIEDLLDNPSASRHDLDRGRSAYIDDKTGTVVIRDPNSRDGGTAFRNRNPRKYLRGLK
jgi:hypothetical protein